jgi:chromosome segregation ATPase
MNKKKILVICADYSFYIIRFIGLLLKQIKEYKNEIIKLLKNNHEYELKINTLTKELDDIKNYLNKYSISKRIFGEKEKENAIKLIRDKYTHKENEYIVSMYKLQDEIHSLMNLLEKNKNYFNKYKEVEKEVNNNKKNSDLLRIKFNKELHEKNLQFAIEKDKREELINQLNELKNTIKELKEQKDQQKRQEIEITAQVLKMKIVIDEKNENLMMMSEELEHYMREYNKERYNYQNTLTVLRALENRIYNEEKEKKNETETLNDKSDSDSDDKVETKNNNKEAQLKLDDN